MFRIGEFAGLAGVSARTLRAWDAIGLFRPAWIDRGTGYRGYSPAQLPELRRIVALRDVGVPLVEIGRLVEGGADLRTVLDHRRAELERERREVDRRLAALDITVAAVDGDRDRTADVVVRPVAAERVATYALRPADTDLNPAFYALEAHVRDRGRRAARPPGALSDEANARFTEVFVPVRGPVPSADRIAYRRLPACRAASIIHRGSYAGLAASLAALRAWVAAAGLTAAGPLRILYLQFGAEPELRVPPAYLVDRSADFVTELQLPVADAT
jgi:DNA-binding transcriptional MerR regulator/effector-binding domain-containing protein